MPPGSSTPPPAARLKAKCGRQAETGQGGARIDGDGAGETGGSFFDAARLEKRVSEVAMTVGARRIELDGPAVHRHGFTQPARIAPCIAKVIQGIGGRRKHLLIVGPQLERALEALERFRPLPKIMQREPEIAVRLGVLGQKLHRAAQGRQRILALSHEGDAQDLPQHSGIGMPRQQGSCVPFGLPQPLLFDQGDERADLLRAKARLARAQRRAPVRSSACTCARCRRGNSRFDRASCLRGQSRWRSIASPSARSSGSRYGSKFLHCSSPSR